MTFCRCNHQGRCSYVCVILLIVSWLYQQVSSQVHRVPMIDVMDMQFDTLTIKLDVFMNAIGIGNAWTKKIVFHC